MVEDTKSMDSKESKGLKKNKKRRSRNSLQALGWNLTPKQIAAAFKSTRDPVKELKLEEKREKKQLMREMMSKENEEEKPVGVDPCIKPSIGTRMELTKPYEFVLEEGQPRPEFVMPVKRKHIREAIRRRKIKEFERNFCKYETLKVPQPVGTTEVPVDMGIPSPDVSKAQVMPRQPTVSPSSGWPPAPPQDELKLRKPKSGIKINETGEQQSMEYYDSFDLVYQRKPRPEPSQKKRKKKRKGEESEEPKKKKKKKKKRKKSVKVQAEDIPVMTGSLTAEQIADMLKIANQMEAEEEEGEGEGMGDLLDDYLTKQFRRKVSQASKATSLNEKELLGFPAYEDEDLESIPVISKIIQKFRRDSEEERYKPPIRKIKRGTLESHSFTRMEQKTLNTFFFGSKSGTMHQGDEHFPVISRNHQGICMPVAAYCFAQIKHPSEWTEASLDRILDIGDQLFHDSMDHLHLHEDKRELDAKDLCKHIFLGDKKVRYEIYEPEISGLVRSEDKKVYNLSKGLKLFYKRHRAGILQTYDVNILIWKDKHYYFYDATPRLNDMIHNPKGAARLANFYDIPSIVTILLTRSRLGNWPFIISKISIVKITNKNDLQEEESLSVINERSDYFILNEKKAVVQASFDLGDMCFDFSRNKQAMAMATVCLAYSRITPPSAWHQKTIDKIMIIGNQLYLECIKCDDLCGELRLDDVPAAFTLGPYIVEIFIFSNRFADLMYKKSQCEFQRCLELFFEKNTNAVVQIGKATLAIWMQRNVYYCFDPYSRNNEGLLCRNGAACVTMNSDIDTLVQTVVTNFDKRDAIFYMHALKVLKIHRDPVQSELFPKNMTMNDYSPETFRKYKMKKSKKAATEKPVTVDFTEFAMKKIHATESPGDSLIEIGSTVESLTPEQMPPMMYRYPSRSVLRTNLPQCEKIADLDSPSLSDTQIIPNRPTPEDEEDLAGMDLDAFELTIEELEMLDQGEGEGGEGGGRRYGGEGGGEGVDAMDAYMAMSIYSQVHSASLDSYHSKLSAQINTEITCGFLPLKRQVLRPTNIARKQRLAKEYESKVPKSKMYESSRTQEPEVTQSVELAKESNFVDLPDGTQLVRGSMNMSNYGTELEYMAPFVCMMTAAVAQKYAIISWSGDIVDYVLKCGSELYKASQVRYDQVPRLEVPKLSLGKNDYSITVDYIFDAYMKQRILEMALDKILFAKTDCGILVTPSYACSMFLKNNLYYMYDGFGCNEVGLGEGPTNEGSACFSRFKDIHSMAKRIMYNKKKRESAEQVDYTRFVLSSCRARPVLPEPEKIKGKKTIEEMLSDVDEGEDDVSKATEEPKSKGGKEEPVGEPTNLVGYQFNGGFLTIQGTKALKGRNIITNELKEDHFICLCACLMLINCPIKKWDTKKVDYVIDQGKHIFSHANDLEVSSKRTIRNILVDKYFFDIIVRRIDIADWQKNRTLEIGIDTVITKKHAYFLIQFPNSCYVIHKYQEFYHMFDPYPCKSDGKMDASEGGKGGWTMFRDLNQLKKRLKGNVMDGGEDYTFYSFDVTSFKKAPKKVLVAQRLHLYEMDRVKPAEHIGKPLHEDETWLNVDPIPWSQMKARTANGTIRGKKENMWNNWDTEYSKDLYSIVGSLHQTSTKFSVETRGKQTLANLIVAIAMTDIYELTEWNMSIMDSILVNGDNYFRECIKDIKDPDYEIAMEDLKKTCSIFPYSFKISYEPVIDGTIFLLRLKQYNLYKALRMFFDNYDNRYGVICATRDEGKRIVGFGKIHESEYFMYDCEAYGPPMFQERTGVSYMLRMLTLNRLVYVLTMTLRGGDFYIYQVETSDFKPMD